MSAQVLVIGVEQATSHCLCHCPSIPKHICDARRRHINILVPGQHFVDSFKFIFRMKIVIFWFIFRCTIFLIINEPALDPIIGRRRTDDKPFSGLNDCLVYRRIYAPRGLNEWILLLLNRYDIWPWNRLPEFDFVIMYIIESRLNFHHVSNPNSWSPFSSKSGDGNLNVSLKKLVM